MNGLLGNVHTSNQAVEIQFFRKFKSKQQINCLDMQNTQFTSDVVEQLIPNLQPENHTAIGND